MWSCGAVINAEERREEGGSGGRAEKINTEEEEGKMRYTEKMKSGLFYLEEKRGFWVEEGVRCIAGRDWGESMLGVVVWKVCAESFRVRG